MQISKNRIFLLLVLILPCTFFSDCAQIGTLSGGDKDTIPPGVVRSHPRIYALNTETDKIEFVFNEFVVLDGMRSKFYSSPPLKEYPDFRIKGKKLIIKFKEKLQDSVTYFFNFGAGIKDYTEGNYLKNFSYVFSTGSRIDSMQIAGRLLKANDLKPEQGMGIMLYDTYNDSVVSNRKPVYYALTDSSGFFSIPYIKAGKYKISAIKDNDANLQFNLPNERIAYLDTLIVPSLRVENEIDTLEAGSINAKGDTLTQDSIFTITNRIYSPENLILLSFEENHETQYVKNFTRPISGKLELKYNMPVENISLWFPFEKIDRKDTLMQLSDTSNTQVIWLQNPNLYNKDSLHLCAQYPLKDSLGMEYLNTDTLLFTNKKDEKDTASLNSFSYTFSKEIGFFENPKLVFEAPLRKIDTSKIRLIQLIDTAVADTKEQQLVSYLRPQADLLIFKFKRAVEKFSLFSEQKKFLCEIEHNAKSDSFWCKLTNSQATVDTLDLEIHFDNDYFFSQKQQFIKKIKIAYTPQSVKLTERYTPENYKIEFIKPLANDFSLYDVNLEQPVEYKIDSIKNKRYYYLSFTDLSQQNTDTLILKIETKDYPYPDGSVKSYTSKLQAVYKPKEQYIRRAERVSRQGFYLAFNRPVANSDVKVFDAQNKNLQALLIESDSMYFDDIRWKMVDTLKIKAVYKDEYEKQKVDYFALRVEPKKKTIRRRAEFYNSEDLDLNKITAEKELPFFIKKDTESCLNYVLISKFEGDKIYNLQADSAAFIDIFGRRCLKTKNKLDVKAIDYYIDMEINLFNVGNIARKDFYSSEILNKIRYPSIDKGQLVVQLLDEKNNLYKQIITKKDTLIRIDRLPPKRYILKAFYDENNDGKWNSGNYYKNIQPERVIFMPKEINVKSGWSFKYDWYINFTPK